MPVEKTGAGYINPLKITQGRVGSKRDNLSGKLRSLKVKIEFYATIFLVYFQLVHVLCIMEMYIGLK